MKLAFVKRQIVFIGVSLLIAIIMRAFFFRAYLVSSNSMSPLLLPGDHILCLKTHSAYPLLVSNDVIVFKSFTSSSVLFPLLTKENSNADIEGTRNELEKINFLEELLVKRIVQVKSHSNKGIIYFVAGDNARQSLASDAIGEVMQSDVIALVFMRYYPLNRISLLNF